MSKRLGLTVVIISILLIAYTTTHQDVYAENDDEHHDNKKYDNHTDNEKHEKVEKIKDKIKEKVEKIKEKIKDKIKEKVEKIKEKIKDKIKEKKDQKIAKNTGKDGEDADNEEEKVADGYEEKQISKVTEDVDNEEKQIHRPMAFKGDGNDYAPTLGIDRYGNKYVDNGFTLNNFKTDVENFKTHMPLQTLQVGEPNTAVLKIYDNRGAGKIEHVEMIFGFGKKQSSEESKTSITWEQNFKGSQSIKMNDENNALMDVNAIGKAEGKIMTITFDFTFREPMDESKVGIVTWDQDGHSRTVYFNDGVEVVGKSLNPPKKVSILDDKGHAVVLTMTGKNTAIDEEGSMWTHNSPWKKISQPLKNQPEDNIPDYVGSQGFDRMHNMFDSYKNSQAQKAQQKLAELMGGKDIYNFSY